MWKRVGLTPPEWFGPVRNLMTSLGRMARRAISDSECLVLPVVAVAVVDGNTSEGEISMKI